MTLNYKLRRPKHKLRYNMPYPGDSVQIDIKFVKIKHRNVFQFSAIDDCTRISLVKFYPERSNTAALDFAQFVISSLPFKIKSIQTDNDAVFTISNPKAIDSMHHFTRLLSVYFGYIYEAIRYYNRIRLPIVYGK